MVPHRLPSPRLPLERRTPGDTDLRIFTTEPLPVGRHRLDRSRRRSRVVRDRTTARATLLRLGVLAVAAVLAAGCASGSDTAAGGQSASGTAGSGDPDDLRGVCPATVVVQSSWYPQVEHAALYQLLGAGSRIDANRKTVSGPLVAAGVDTGVTLEIRAGGPAIGSQQVSAQMSADPSITLGMLNSDELVQQSAAHPLLGVVAPLDLDPQVVLWDPAAHPDWNTIQDIGQTDTTVLYYQGTPFMDYLLGAGILRPSQTDASYTGTPDRFVAARGTIAVQGYATNEPYAWQHEVPQWGKPLTYALVNDTGYPNYANLLAIRPADRARLDGCLRKLVPVIQRAQVDFMAKPAPTVALIVKAVAAQHGFTYTQALADYAVKTMRDQGIVGNGKDRVLGDFQDDRIRRLIDILTPIFTGQHKPIRAGLTPAGLVTNDYIDPAIGLPAGR
jgi:hypothetical protein